MIEPSQYGQPSAAPTAGNNSSNARINAILHKLADRDKETQQLVDTGMLAVHVTSFTATYFTKGSHLLVRRGRPFQAAPS